MPRNLTTVTTARPEPTAPAPRERDDLTARLRETEAEIARLTTETERCKALATAADAAASVVDGLRKQRAETLAASLINNAPAAALAGIDAELAKATQTRDAAIEHAEDGAVMVVALDRRIDELRAEHANVRARLVELARAELDARREQAMERYEQAVASLADPVREVAAIIRASAALTGRAGNARNALAEMLTNEGLRVRTGPGAVRPWRAPQWLYEMDANGRAYQALRAELQTWGLDIE